MKLNRPFGPRRQLYGPYVFKSGLKRRLAALVDAVGGRLYPRDSKPVPWEKLERVAVLRLDHLGDVVMALPALTALGKALPGTRVDFFIGPWSRGISGFLPRLTGVRTFSAPWFDRSGDRTSTLKAIRELSNVLREGRYDVVVDLRGDFRHLLAMKRSAIPTRIGPTVTGGGFLLTHPVHLPLGLHEIDGDLEVFRQSGLGIETGAGWPRLAMNSEGKKEAEEVHRSLGMTHPVVALHATCLAPAKRWPDAHWRRLVEGMPEGLDLVAVGSEGEGEQARRLFGPCRRKVFFALGLFSLPGLASFFETCRLFIGVDSAPAHVAAAIGTPVISLFSGTNVATQWGPRGREVTLLQKKTPCSPCQRTACPFDNKCMSLIEVGEVLAATTKILGKGL
jgi:ADP-heptose:LPS heptosyltransferase